MCAVLWATRFQSLVERKNWDGTAPREDGLQESEEEGKIQDDFRVSILSNRVVGEWGGLVTVSGKD